MNYMNQVDSKVIAGFGGSCNFPAVAGEPAPASAYPTCNGLPPFPGYAFVSKQLLERRVIDVPIDPPI